MIGRGASPCHLQILALALGATLAAAQQPPAGGMGGMPRIPTVEVTDESAKHAIDAYKEQMLGMLKSTRPSANNLAVVKEILADPTYAAKIEAITK